MMGVWIDVRSQKPADGQQVIGWEDYRLIGMDHQGPEIFYYRADWGFVASPLDEVVSVVTHWMPLPFDQGPNVSIEDLDFSMYPQRGNYDES
jgi:hypothetical protein